MPTIVYMLPDELVLALTVFGLTGLCAAGPFVLAALRRHPLSKASHDSALDALKLVGPLIAVFAAFLLLQSVNRLNAANQSVSAETADILQLDRALARIETPQAKEARLALRAYIGAFATTGWAAMRRGELDPVTAARFDTLVASVQALSGNEDNVPALQTAHDAMDTLEDSRAARLAVAFSGLPALFWVALACLVTIFICLASMTSPVLQEVVPRAGYMMALSILLALLVLYDHPFQGRYSASIDPLQRVLIKFDRAQRAG